jgi:hypothetical protein
MACGAGDNKPIHSARDSAASRPLPSDGFRPWADRSAPRRGNLRELHKHAIKKKTQIDAFSLAMFARQVHAVVPATGADESYTIFTEGEPVQYGVNTVFIKTRRLFGALGQIIIRVLIRFYREAMDESDGLIQHPGVSGG